MKSPIQKKIAKLEQKVDVAEGLLRRFYKIIEDSHKTDHKLIRHYCKSFQVPRQLGDDVFEYLSAEKKRKIRGCTMKEYIQSKINRIIAYYQYAQLLLRMKWFGFTFWITVERKCTCKHCCDGYFLPIYGIAPHSHDLSKTGSFIGSTVFGSKEKWPDNFVPEDEEGMTGVYYCPEEGCPNHKDNHWINQEKTT